MSVSRPPSDGGFSLVEVLVALAVAGLIMTATTGLSWTVRRVEERASRENAAREGVIAADRVLRAVVEGAAPDVRPRSRDQRLGDAASATFVTFGPAILTFDRPRPVTLAIESADSGARLVARWTDPESGQAREEPILEGARSLALSYFGASERGEPAGWRSSWERPRRLPAAVLLRVDSPALGPPIDLIARTYGRLPDACAALPHEPECHWDEPSVAEAAE